jgi:hypothetical protein
MLMTTAAVHDGKLFMPGREDFEAAVARWPNCRAILRLEQSRAPRSLALLAYYWGVLVNHVSEEIGEHPRDAHELLKDLHLPSRLHGMRAGAICWRCARIINGSTTVIANDEMQRFCADTQIWAAKSLGIVIPDPNQSDVVAA